MSAAPPKIDPVMRGTLEHIRDRFSADHPRYVLFTTFNFASQFFEANVLPLLVGDTVDELKGTSETRYVINEDLSVIKCLVACDRSTCPEPKGDMRYGLLPVGLPEGRFHPKLMLMAGTLKQTQEKGLWLSVGSGNLTLSGWAVNREVVGMTVVARQHADELRPLLVWLANQAERHFTSADGETLEEEGDVRAILTALLEALSDASQVASDTADMPTLHLSLPFERDTRHSLLDALKGPRSWRAATVVSPYWSGVETLVQKLGVGECRFVPSLNADGKYRFPVETLSASPGYRRGFRKFCTDGERYTHAKALMLEDGTEARVLCIGSANFTEAAMLAPQGQSLANVEAMFRYDLKNGTDPWNGRFHPLDENELEPSEARQDEDNAPPLPPFDAIVLCDWRARVFCAQLTITSNQSIRDIVLRVDSFEYQFAATPAGEMQTMPPLPFKGAQPVRSFSVSYTSGKDGTATFRGLVTQVNALPDELGYQPRPRLKKVLELLRSLNPDAPDGKTRERAALGLGGGDGEEESAEPTFDFFGLFQGTWKLREFYQRPDSAGKNRDPYDKQAPYGAANLYRAITLQPATTPEEKIGRYIQLMEMRDVVNRLDGTGQYRSSPLFLKDIDEKIDELHGDMVSLIGNSPSFISMFGTATPERINDFLGWFRREITKEISQKTGAPHAE
ncbi:hypothetical protein [Trinickia mobilis]|uniref:hypothetical protein n=1 Tax=Trinickia mobilis TaxID=2816356 RepID=UPI001A8C59BB|nr:hypothetical protein [Trinickia mobilis]